MTGEERRVLALEVARTLPYHNIQELIMYADAIERWLQIGGTLAFRRDDK